MTFTLEGGFTGDKELAARLQKFRDDTPKEFRKALLVVGAKKLAAAQDRVPVDTGKLKGTGRMSVRAGKQQVMLAIGFGGPEAPYAGIVHEDLSKRHKNGQAKYLESVFNEDVGGLGQELAAEMNFR